MNWLEGVVLGLIQGLSEFLPISSSGHLTIFQYFFGISGAQNLTFDVVVHCATVLSTIVVFRKPISNLLYGIFVEGSGKDKDYVYKLLISMIPILFVGLFLKPLVDKIFDTTVIAKHTGNGLLVVGIALVVTSILLLASEIISAVRDLRNGADADAKNQRIADKLKVEEGMTRSQKRKIYAQQNGIKYWQAFVVGIAQAIAVIPGLSRSGSTITTGLMTNVKKGSIAQFSFLMVIVPILGESFLSIVKGINEIKGFDEGTSTIIENSIGILPLVCGFVAAFVSGLFACKWMIAILKKFNLYPFAVYTFIIGVLCIVLPYILHTR